MGKLRFLVALWMAKLSVPALKITRHDGTDFPGALACRLCPDFLRYIGKPETIVAVTGTNGKTTVTNTIADILEKNGRHVLSNRAGSNMWSGIATTLLGGCGLGGRLRKGYDTAVLEVDERSSPRIYPYVEPDVLVVTNLFRDSIKRNGHSEYIFGKIAQALPKKTRLLLNGDDVISGLLGQGTNERVFYSVARTERSTDTCANTTCDRSACPCCGHLLTFDYYHYHHIGKARCPHCGFALPEAVFQAAEVDFDHCRFTLRELGQAELSLPFRGGNLFGVFNTAAAVGCCRMLGLAGADIARAIEEPELQTGRFESRKAGELEIVTMLSKNQNPISSTQSIAYLSHVPGKKTVVLTITDSLDKVHGHEDISWLYDTDFDVLRDESVETVYIGGRRCYDLALRLILSGVAQEKLQLFPDYGELEQALIRQAPTEGTVAIFFELYAKPIAMGLRKALAKHEEVQA